MSGIVCFEVVFHLFPLYVLLIYQRVQKLYKIHILIASLIIFSFLADLIGLLLAKYGQNTYVVFSLYLIIERVISVLVLNSFSTIRLKIKKLILAAIFIVSITQISSCFFNNYLSQNDYINLFAGVIIGLYALHTAFNLVFKAVDDSLKIDLNILPVLAIVFFMSAMLIPDMITNIDDSIEFPKLFQQVRIGVAVGSNIIRDSLFALFFFKVKKINYDTGK
jgi:hypothetical protein